jgi:NAD(P)-dependent dehydrogenase (short-subunit alcohol dehydrogenase family)
MLGGIAGGDLRARRDHAMISILMGCGLRRSELVALDMEHVQTRQGHWAQMERQLATSLIGPMNVTRAVLPVMRKQRSGHIISISSSAGLAAEFEFCTAYAASKFGLEGWMESLQAEVAPFGITTTVVNPGFFRTELLTEQSTNYAEPSIEDYDERRAKQLEFWKAQNGQQSGDPAKLARALITIASQEPPPRRFIAGADAIATAEQKVANLKAQIDAERDLSTSLDFD